jgi:predicted nucleic-acid-binding protein
LHCFSVYQYKKDRDFADLLIVNQAIEQHAKKLISFDKKLQKKFSGYVVDKIGRKDL